MRYVILFTIVILSTMTSCACKISTDIDMLCDPSDLVKEMGSK